MNTVARSLDIPVDADLHPFERAIYTEGGCEPLPSLERLYLLGQIVICVITICFPLYALAPLLLGAGIILFFPVALAVLSCVYYLIILVSCRMAVGLYHQYHHIMGAKPSAPAPGGRGAGVWDRWLDD